MFSRFAKKINMYLSRVIADRRRADMEIYMVNDYAKMYYNFGNPSGNNHKKFPCLTSEQKSEVDRIYGKYQKALDYKYSYRMHEVSSVIRGKFEPEIVPCSLFFARMREIMNNGIYRESRREKNLFDILQPHGRFPKVIPKEHSWISL